MKAKLSNLYLSHQQFFVSILRYVLLGGIATSLAASVFWKVKEYNAGFASFSSAMIWSASLIGNLIAPIVIFICWRRIFGHPIIELKNQTPPQDPEVFLNQLLLRGWSIIPAAVILAAAGWFAHEITGLLIDSLVSAILLVYYITYVILVVVAAFTRPPKPRDD